MITVKILSWLGLDKSGVTEDLSQDIIPVAVLFNRAIVMEVICIETEAFYSLVEKVVKELREKEDKVDNE